MEKLPLTALVVPLIALFLLILLYLFTLQRAINKSLFWWFTGILVIVSFILNFIWEMLQMPFYQGMALNGRTTAFCALASVADTIMVLLLYFLFASILKSPFWLNPAKPLKVIVLIGLGGIGAVVGELGHLAAGSWAYSNSMPLLPFIHVGLVPVLQFMILPLVIYFLSAYFLNRIRHEN